MASYAFVAGVNNYVVANDGLGKLGGAARDANNFIDWLKDPQGGNLPDENIYSIISPENEDTLTMINDATQKIITLVAKLGQPPVALNDRLYFYFAGHGVGHPDEIDENLLCFSDWTKLWCNNAVSAVPAISFFRYLGVFQEIIFIFDCCRTRYIRAKLEAFVTQNVRYRNYNQANVVVAYATTYDDEAHEYDEAPIGDDNTTTNKVEKRGVFTEVLLKGLRGEAANEDGDIDHHSLSKYLTKEVNIKAQEKGFSQEPQFSVTLGGGRSRVLFSKVQVSKIAVEFNLKGPDEYILNNSKDQFVQDIAVTATGTTTVSLPKDYYTIIRKSDNESVVFRVNDSTNTITLL